MRSNRSFAAIALVTALLAGFSTGTTSANEQQKSEPIGDDGSPIIGMYFAGVVAGLRGDAASSADYLLDVAGRVEPVEEVLGPALRAAISAGRLDDGLVVAKALVALDPQSSEPALLLLFADAARRQDWKTARGYLAQLPGGNLSETRERLLEAWASLPDEGVAKALEILAPIGQRSGLETLYDLHKALLLDVSGKPEAAEAYKVLVETESAPSGRAVLLASNYMARHGDKDGALALIDAQLAQGRGNATLQAVRAELAALGPDQTPDPIVPDARSGVSEVFLQIGAALADEAPGALALQEAEMADFVTPNSSAAILLLSEVLSRMNRHDEAVAGYDRLLKDPRHGTVAALARADALAAAKRIGEAEAAYREIGQQLADDPEPMIRLGNMLRWERRFDESLAAYDEAVARNGAPKANDWLLYYFRGISNERSGHWEAAENDFQEALTLQPEQPQVLNYLGYSWVERGENLAEARHMLERAVELRPRDGYIVDSLGWALYQLGDFEGAVTQLERAVELEPGQAVINDHLGDAYWRVGRVREAMVQWHRTLSLGEDPDVVPEEVELKLREGLPPLHLPAKAPAEEMPAKSDGNTL